MNNVTILSIFFSLLVNGVKHEDYISFEYCGNTNKPMRVMYISKKPIPYTEQVVSYGYSDLPENYIVHASEFLFLHKLINSMAKTSEEGYNGFKIVMRDNNSAVSYFITRKKADSLFLKINAYLKHSSTNKDLILSLEVLRRTNVFDENGILKFPK